MEYLINMKKRPNKVKFFQFKILSMVKNLAYEEYQYNTINKIQIIQKNIQTLAKTAITHQNVRVIPII